MRFLALLGMTRLLWCLLLARAGGKNVGLSNKTSSILGFEIFAFSAFNIADKWNCRHNNYNARCVAFARNYLLKHKFQQAASSVFL